MSRIGKQPINVPEGVNVTIDGNQIMVKGPKGELNMSFDNYVSVDNKEGYIYVSKRLNSKAAKQSWGLYRSLISNMVTGVTEGYSKTLNIDGVGYKASIQGKYLTLSLGYSHDIKYYIPDDIEINSIKPTVIEIKSYNKESLGQAAATIRSLRKPEPYKGKGVKYEGEFIFRKEGKK